MSHVEIDWEAVHARTRELHREGRAPWPILLQEFPELGQRHKAQTARHVEMAIWDMAEPVTPDPDHGEPPPPVFGPGVRISKTEKETP